MTTRRARIIGLSILAVCFVLIVASVPIQMANSRARSSGIVIVGDPGAPRVQGLLDEAGGRDYSPRGPNPGIVAILALCFLWIGVGVLIVSRQPRNWAGWTFIAVAAPFPVLIAAGALVVYGTRTRPDSVPLLSVWATLGEFALYPVALLPLLFLLYPDGHAPSPRWRWAARGLLGGTLLAALGFLLRPGPFNNFVDDGILFINPIGVDPFARISGVLIGIGAVTAVVSALSTTVAVAQRFRRSTGEQRQQMRRLVLVAGAAGASLLSLIVWGAVSEPLGFGEENDNPIFPILFGLTAFTLVIGTPAAYLIAIFRHGLWDLDVVIQKTVQYAVVVAAFMLAGFLIVGAIPTLVLGVGSGADLVPVFLLASVPTAVFLWLRPRAARFANRVVYGKRATPYEVLSEFSERVGETYSTDDVLPRMAQLVADATGAARVDVWLRVGPLLRPEASWPDAADVATDRRITDDVVSATDGEYVCEVRHQGDLLGAITLEPSPDDPMDPAKETLVRDLAAQAGLVLRNVRLIGDLRASRQRLVAAQDEERRKLERNIHDGAQQQLVALSVQLRLAEHVVEREPQKARTMLADLQTQTNATLEDLRDLARGIYPPLLADKGLHAALEAQARKAVVSTSVRSEGVGRYPPDVESAVYFCVLEAMNNIAKYSGASNASISLMQRNGSLEVTVRDDGRGFDVAGATGGSGLQGIADRLEAIGGALRIESSPGHGAMLSGLVPATTIGTAGGAT